MRAVAKPNARGIPTPAPMPASMPACDGQIPWFVVVLQAAVELEPALEEVALAPIVEFDGEDSDFKVAFRGSAK